MILKMRKCLFLIALIAIAVFPASNALSQEYEAMQGVTSTKTVFDFRVADPEVALGHLDLIHSMLDSQALTREDSKPELVVVFIGPSVNHVSTDTMEAVQAEKDAFAEKISAMDADGVRFEICMVAAHSFDIDPDSILPEIEQVGNGWISLIGYQHNGYAMIADF